MGFFDKLKAGMGIGGAKLETINAIVFRIRR